MRAGESAGLLRECSEKHERTHAIMCPIGHEIVGLTGKIGRIGCSHPSSGYVVVRHPESTTSTLNFRMPVTGNMWRFSRLEGQSA